jgi:hypothetical protein
MTWRGAQPKAPERMRVEVLKSRLLPRGRLKRLNRVIKGAVALYRHKDALLIEDTLRHRLQELLAKHHPEIRVELRRWQWTHLYNVCWGGSFSALVYLDGSCYCGMSFDLIGKNLIISQIHGVHLNRCRYRPMRRFWEVTLVRAAHDLGYRTLLIRASHAISWEFGTPAVRERLIKRLDEPARALGMVAKGGYWVWEAGRRHPPRSKAPV